MCDQRRDISCRKSSTSMLISSIALTNSSQNSRYDNDTDQIDIIHNNQFTHISQSHKSCQTQSTRYKYSLSYFFYEVMRIISPEVSRKTACETAKETHIYRDIREATNMIPT